MASRQAPEYAPDGRPIWARNENGEPICGYITKNGHFCQNRVLGVEGRCKLKRHGGGTSAGISSRQKTLRKIGQLGKLVEAAKNDPDRSCSEANHDLIEGLIQQAMLTIDPDNVPDWPEALKLYQTVRKEGYDSDKGEVAWRDLGDLLRDGAGEEKLENRLVNLAEAQGKHKDRIQKREEYLQAVLKGQEAIVLAGNLLQAVLDKSHDFAIQHGIAPEFVQPYLQSIALNFAQLMLSAGLPGLDGGSRVAPSVAQRSLDQDERQTNHPVRAKSGTGSISR